MSAALVINDLTVSEELDREAMIAILGGGSKRTSWELCDSWNKFKGFKERCGQKYRVYKCFEKYVKYKTKCFYKYVPVCGCDYNYK